MGFHIRHRYGEMERNPNRTAFVALLQELDQGPEDKEHGSVGVTHESEWDISVARGGYVTFENLEENSPRHMLNIGKCKIIELWSLLADGDLEAIEREPWEPGY